MANVKPMRVAVVGCGVISGIYLENIASMFSVLELAAVCDANAPAADAAAAKYGVPVMTLDELAKSDIPLVINLTPPLAHHPVVKALLTAGKHVYTEKPLADTFAHAKELVELAAANGVSLACAPDTFLGAAAQTARRVLESGLIGDVTGCLVALNRDNGVIAERFPFTALPGGGIATDVGIYYMTVLAGIFGPVREVCGYAVTVRPERRHSLMTRDDFGLPYTMQSETVVAGAFSFDCGVLGSIHLNANSTQNEQPVLTLYGSEGILYLPDPNRFGGDVKVLMKGQNAPFVFPPTHGFEGNSRALGVAEQAWALARGRKPRADAAMGLNALEALLGLFESMKTKRYYTCESTFTTPPPLPHGFLDSRYQNVTPESGLAI